MAWSRQTKVLLTNSREARSDTCLCRENFGSLTKIFFVHHLLIVVAKKMVAGMNLPLANCVMQLLGPFITLPCICAL